MGKRALVDRRTVLRGMLYGGVTSLALPLLEQFLDGNGVAYADGTPLPNRFVLLFWGNGTRLKQWIPSKTGRGYPLSPILSSYAPVKDYVSVISGAEYKTRGTVHHEGAAGMLTAAPYTPQQGINSTVSTLSFDQVMAKQLGAGSRFKSLELAVTKGAYGIEGTTLQYIYHNGPDDPNPPEFSPAALFQRIFGGNSLDGRYGSVLDTVLADIAVLQKRVGASDRARLDAYAAQVRTIEMSLQGGQGGCSQPPNPGKDTADLNTVANLTSRSNALWSLMATSLACDLTRVVSVQYSAGVGGNVLPSEVYKNTPIYEGGQKPILNDNIHNITHNESTKEQPAVATACAFFQSQFSNLLQKMVATPDGSGNLLDNSVVMATSEVAEGHNHRSLHVPIVLAGRARGKLVSTGIHYAGNASKGAGAIVAASPANNWDDFGDCTTAADNAMNATNVHLTLLRAMGSTQTSYGLKEAASKTTIPELLV